MFNKTIFVAAIVMLVALYLSGRAQEPQQEPVRDAITEDDRDPNTATRDEFNREFRDVGRAIGRMNQSYVIAPVVGHSAATGGSYHIDTIDDSAVRDGEQLRDDERLRDRADARGVRLPPPVLITPNGNYELPAWLYGEVPLRRRPREEVPGDDDLQDRPTPEDDRAGENPQSRRATPRVYQTEIYNRGRRSVRTFRAVD